VKIEEYGCGEEGQVSVGDEVIEKQENDDDAVWITEFVFSLYPDMRKRWHWSAWKHMMDRDMKLEQKTKHSGTMGTHERDKWSSICK